MREDDDSAPVDKKAPRKKGDLRNRLKKISAAGVDQMTMADTDFFDQSKTITTTAYRIFNAAMSGRIDGGIPSGVTFLAGPSKCFKTITGVLLTKDWLDAHPNGIVLFYDTEFGAASYWENAGADMERIIHIPVESVEMMKNDIVQKLDEIDVGEEVLIFYDSLGMTASRKEIEDAKNDKNVADFTRAKAIKSLFRMVTPTLGIKRIPMIVINHTIQTIEMYSKQVMTGGTGAVYAANQILFFSKSKVRDGNDENATDGDNVGFRFTITVDKSRFVKEGSKFPFEVRYGHFGPDKNAGLWDLANLTGDIYSPSRGWRALRLADPKTGELRGGKDPMFREGDVRFDPNFYDRLVNETAFCHNLGKRYQLMAPKFEDVVKAQIADQLGEDADETEVERLARAALESQKLKTGEAIDALRGSAEGLLDEVRSLDV